MDNRVYWITGLSGAGKTTVGMALYARIKAEADNVVILDGDALREVLGAQGDYSWEARRMRGFQYARLCKMLSDQGINVICCTIAMFDDVRAWNRANIEGYVEVFLDVPREVLVSRDSKGLYRRLKSGDVSHVVGFDVDAEFPKHPDIVLPNDGGITVEWCVGEILRLGR